MSAYVSVTLSSRKTGKEYQLVQLTTQTTARVLFLKTTIGCSGYEAEMCYVYFVSDHKEN